MVIDGALSFPGTLAIEVGERVLDARANHQSPVTCCQWSGAVHREGDDVPREIVAGFARGVVILDGSGTLGGERLRIELQNANRIAKTGPGDGLAVVPGLNCPIDTESGEPLIIEFIRYCLRTTVIGIPAPMQLRPEPARLLVGPVSYGFQDVTKAPLAGAYRGMAVMPIRRARWRRGMRYHDCTNSAVA
jgi:DUF917 family protein